MYSLSKTIRTNKDVKILVVEDDYSLALNLQELLETWEYIVVGIANSAESAIEKAKALYPNLILMDIQLPREVDGMQVAKQIWNSLKIPIVYITAFYESKTWGSTEFLHPFAYIIKPVTYQQLYVAIETALERYAIEEFSNSVLQCVGHGIIVVDFQLRVSYLNQLAEIITGWQLNDAQGKSFSDILKLIDKSTQNLIKKAIVSSLQEQTILDKELSTLIVNKNGATIPITNRITSLINRQGFIVGAVIVIQNDT
ncbi:two-component hybrid sensor and regulator [Nostoc sp. NIES-3756]|uniref:response regulator n=1 Tax=Nostoc sp. NIES-3756 TaxID=1751286 RepID=UPI0007210BB2|nr:response regulator [Nostoc sp. NIES-3756]BAT53453.1 two-component hybrid sensor and regulator [Nostoc sp. NIES-3756]BAY38809.1 two-component hybrid sensor and regulator [Nostoc sp. NIES-2111]